MRSQLNPIVSFAVTISVRIYWEMDKPHRLPVNYRVSTRCAYAHWETVFEDVDLEVQGPFIRDAVDWLLIFSEHQSRRSVEFATDEVF